MFINIDHEKRPSDYKLHLAKPNKEIISVLHEKQNSTLNLKLGNISELNFSIPYFVEDSNLQMVKNPNIERIRELMYVKLTWGEFEEWFLIDNITESSEDNEIMNIQSFSIGYENKRKKINEFKETAINATEFYTEILKDSPWSIGEIDGSFDLLYRSFDESGTDRFELIKTGAETFGGVIVWDTDNKKINLKEPDNIGEFRGLTVSYDRLMSSLNKTRTTDEMVTRLYVYGNERITIENKNPTNEKYIEDYSYFMHPFKRDANKNVLESSYYMSDSLCHALLDNKELRDEYEPQIKTIQKNIENKNASLSLAMIELSDAEFTLMSAKGLLDIAKAVDDKALIEQRKTEVSNATSIVNTKKTAVNNLTSQIEVLQNQVSVLQNAISVRSFTKELIDELEPYIIEKEIEDARYIDEDELYEFAKEKFSEIREPRVVIETGIEGLMNSVEEQYYWDKLNLGDTMRVRQKRMNIDYKSRIIEMNVGLDDSDVEVKIANFTENVDNLDKFISILYSSESNSTILNNNKYKWDSVVDIRDEVTQLRESEIDATTKRITAGVNESVEIGERGVVITTPSFPNEMIIMQAGVIALSEDGGENWKTSITPRGVIADTIIGKLVASNNLIVTNDSGSMVLDGTGLTVDADSIKIMSGGSNPKNIIEDWNNMIIDMDNFADDNVLTPYEKSQILHQWNMINDAHTKLIESFIDNMGNETAENPYPLEYDIYLETYERLKNFLFLDKQSDGYSMLDSSRMQFVSPVSSESYRSTLTNYMTAKDDFILVIPMEYTNASIRVLEEGIFLEYVKSDELVASLNLSEEGVRIDGKLLSINSETRFRDDVVMDAGVIKSADNAIRIDLNAGTIDLSRPLTINAVPVATKEDIENIEMTYTPILSNDTANIPTDENGNNGNYYTANTEITIYQQSKDDTINWAITADKSAGITGSLSGNKYTVTNMTTNVGYVDLIAKKSGKTLVKRFTLAKAKDGQSGRIPPMLSLSSTGQIMTFDSGNNPTPSSQEIQVVAKVSNYEGQVSWKIEKFNGNSLVETTTPSKNPQNTIMINQSIMTGNITSVRVTAYDLDANSNFSDYITIYKLKESMDGVGIESITEYYLATSQATGVTSSTSGFTTTIQTMTDVNRYLWNYEKIKYTDGTDKNTVPVIIGVHGQKGDIGDDGRSITSVTEHYLATSLESGVSRGTSGWTTTMQQTDDNKRYLWNYETISWNKAPLTTYVEPVIIGVHGKKGDSGENAELLYLTSTSEIMTFEHDNTPNPSSQVITFVANLQNVTGNATFTAIPYNGTTAMTAISMGGSGNSRTITQSQFPISADRIVVTATIRGLTDYVTIVKLKNGKIGSDGVKGSNAVVGYLTNESITLGANSSGVVASFDNANGTFKVFDGLTDKTSSATFSKVSQTGAVATINSSTGLYSISSMSEDNATVVFRAIYNGATIEKNVSLSKSKSGQDGKNSITALLTNEAMTLPATTSGTVTDFSSANGVFEVFDGTTKVNATAVYSVAYQSNIAVSINQSGAYSVSAMSVGASVTQGTATLRAVYNGVTLEKTLNVSKALVGESGSSATSYWVTSSTNVVKKDVQNNITPTSITFSGFQKVGTNNPTAYSGRFIISTSVNGKDYTNVYTSSSNQTTYEYVVPKDVNFIKARFYQSGGTSVLLDEQTVPVLVDAEGIEIGGRNLLKNSEREVSAVGGREFVTFADLAPIFEEHGIDEVYSLSLDLKSSDISKRNITQVYMQNGRGTRYNFVDSSVIVTKEYTRFKFEGLKPSLVSPTETKATLAFYGTYDTGNFPIVRRVKIEKGNKATDWTEAPEDVEAAYKAVSKAERELAEVNAKAYADGVVSDEEKRAIQDAQNKLGEAKKYVDDLEVGGRNLIVSKDIVQGEYLLEYAGTVASASTHARTGFIEAKPLTNYILSGDKGVVQTRFVSYDAGKNYISGVLYSGDRGASQIYQTPANTAYIRVSADFTTKTHYSRWMLEKGSKATDWTEAPEDVEARISDKASNESVNDVVSGIEEIRSDLVENYAGIGDIQRLDEALTASNTAIEEARADSIQDIKVIDNRTAILEQNFGDYAVDWNFIRTSVRLADEGMRISKAGEKTGLLIQNDKISFVSDDNEVAYITGSELYITQGTFLDNVKIGQHRVSTLPSDNTVTVIRYEG